MDPDVKRLFEELAQLNRDFLNRFDRGWKTIDRRLEAQTAQMREQAAAMREHRLAMREQANEMREQAGAMREIRDAIALNTQGLLRVFEPLDSLEGNA